MRQKKKDADKSNSTSDLSTYAQPAALEFEKARSADPGKYSVLPGKQCFLLLLT